jgi:membrane protease YdiL (CAAX protease family)
VSCVLVITHCGFRAFLHFTPIGAWELESGTYVSPGLALGLAALVAARRAGLGRAESSWTCTGDAWRAGVIASAVFVCLAASCALAGVDADPRNLAGRDGALALAATLLLTSITALALAPRAHARPTSHARLWFALALVGFLAPFVAALATNRALAPVASALVTRGVLASVTEELFFRSYVEARLDRETGTPWSIAGIAFGPGMLVAALFFGAMHVLNPYDYFSGAGRLAWWHGALTAAMPYGLLKSRTGSVVAPIVLHTLVNSIAISARVATGAQP